MSSYLDMLAGAAGSPLDDVMSLADTPPEQRTAAIATGITLGLVACACPVPFVIHAVLNLTAAGVRSAAAEARTTGQERAGGGPAPGPA